MDLALNNLQRLICLNPTNQPCVDTLCIIPVLYDLKIADEYVQHGRIDLQIKAGQQIYLKIFIVWRWRYSLSLYCNQTVQEILLEQQESQ